MVFDLQEHLLKLKLKFNCLHWYTHISHTSPKRISKAQTRYWSISKRLSSTCIWNAHSIYLQSDSKILMCIKVKWHPCEWKRITRIKMASESTLAIKTCLKISNETKRKITMQLCGWLDRCYLLSNMIIPYSIHCMHWKTNIESHISK